MGRRNEVGVRITERDLAIVQWLSRVRFATAEQVARQFALSERVAYRRLRAGVAEELVWHKQPLVGVPGVYGATNTGAQVAKSPLSGSRWDWRHHDHTLAVVDLMIAIGQHYPEAAVQTERELAAALYAQGLPRGERSHLPDGVLRLGDRVVALEVELTAKSATRLQAIFRQYARQREYTDVWYYAAPPVFRRLTQAAHDLSFVRVFPFPLTPDAFMVL